MSAVAAPGPAAVVRDVTVSYAKPHQTYAEQLALLIGRGLQCADPIAAQARLRAVGYYRFSAYVYPFRHMLPAETQKKGQPDPLPRRVDPGRDDVRAGDRLHTQIAQVLGARHTCGHVNGSALNHTVCNAKSGRHGGHDMTAHEVWLDKFDSQVEDAAKEDFVRHNRHKDDELPIWIAVEVTTFGTLVRLLNLMRQDDQTVIARELGVKGGAQLGWWLQAVNYLRNVAGRDRAASARGQSPSRPASRS